MSVLYVALPVAIAMGAAATWACVRSIRRGQFDDLETPPIRMLIDDQPKDALAVLTYDETISKQEGDVK